LRQALISIGSTAPSGDAGFGVTANPSLAISLVARGADGDRLLGATRLKASFGTGIKEPRLDEAFSPSIFFLGNPLLEPERAVSFDAGISQDFFDRRASVELTYFDNRFRDMIVFAFDPATFGPVRLEDGRLANFMNFERATARGVELVGAARPMRRLRVGASYTFLRSRIERAAVAFNSEVGLALLRRPRHSGAIEVSWVERRYDISLDGSFVGRRRDADPVTFSKFDLSGRPFFAEGYAKLNCAGSYHFSDNLSAFARVENLLNDDYQEILGYPAYRINFSAGLRLRFGGRR
jgi:vitamin B12 transporter